MFAPGGEEDVDAALIEFVAALFPPPVGEIGSRSVDGFGDVEQMPLGVEDVHDLGLARLGGPVGLLAPSAAGLFLAHRHAGAVEAEMEGAGIGGLGLDDGRLVGGDLAPERLGVALRRLGVDVESGQFAQQLAALGEADPGRGQAGHAQRRRRQRGSLQPERAVARTEAPAAVRAVIPGALQNDRAERGDEGLAPATGVAGLRPARAGSPRTLLVGAVGVQVRGDGPPHDLERQPPRRRLDRLEVDAVRRPCADQPLDLGADLRRDGFREAPFFAASAASRPVARRAWHNASLTSINSRVRSRNRWYSATCSRVPSTPASAMLQLRRLPLTVRVSTHFGPCPGSSSRAQWQAGLPHLR